MKTQSELSSSSMVGLPKVTTISRFISLESDHEKNAGWDHHEIRTGCGTEAVALMSDVRLHYSEALPRNDFVRQLHREKRRAERSKSPLSIVVYRLHEEVDEATFCRDIGELLEVLHKVSRETDSIGFLDNQLIAVLCPDTDEHGLNSYVRKVELLASGRKLTYEAATYPDQLFDSLASGNRLQPTVRQLVSEGIGQRSAYGYRMKRLLDIVGASILLLLLSPLMLVVAIFVAVTSPGPVIFKQMRLGAGGVPFAFYKFRSMAINIDDGIHRNFVSNLIKGEMPENSQNRGDEVVYKIRRDPRVTRIGRIIRKTSIDELPQLFNVLKGDMSLVGPRPPIPYEAEIYQAWHLRRILNAKPGITGLWQVQARSAVSFNDMVRLDLRYIRECSLWLDIKILLKTVGVVLRCDGAV